MSATQTTPYSVGTIGKDVSTIVSIIPIGTKETKPGLYPSIYTIPPCINDNEPVLVHVESAVHLVNLPDDRPPMRVLTPSWEVCRSIVEDFFDGQLQIDDDSRPGLAFVKSQEVNLSDFKTDSRLQALLKHLKEMQRNHYMLVVRTADDDWTHYHSHKVISDYQRFAARALGLHVKKEWAVSITTNTMPNTCPACMTPVPVGIIVCPTCKCVIDVEKFKNLQFA